MKLQHWGALFKVILFIGLGLNYWISPWGFFFAIPLVLWLLFFCAANYAWFGARWTRKWFWHLFARRNFEAILDNTSPLISFPMSAWLVFEGEAKYIELGHDKFIEHILAIVEEKTKYMMDVVTGKITPPRREYTLLEMNGLTNLDKDLDDPNNWDEHGNFHDPKQSKQNHEKRTTKGIFAPRGLRAFRWLGKLTFQRRPGRHRATSGLCTGFPLD